MPLKQAKMAKTAKKSIDKNYASNVRNSLGIHSTRYVHTSESWRWVKSGGVWGRSARTMMTPQSKAGLANPWDSAAKERSKSPAKPVLPNSKKWPEHFVRMQAIGLISGYVDMELTGLPWTYSKTCAKRKRFAPEIKTERVICHHLPSPGYHFTTWIIDHLKCLIYPTCTTQSKFLTRLDISKLSSSLISSFNYPVNSNVLFLFLKNSFRSSVLLAIIWHLLLAQVLLSVPALGNKIRLGRSNAKYHTITLFP